MKTAIIFVGILAFASASVRVTLDHEIKQLVAYEKLRGMDRGAIEDSILALVECLRQMLQEGGDLTGGMILDPLDVKHLDVDLELPEMLTMKGALDDLLVKGISSFNFNSLKLNLLQMKVDYNVTLDHLMATGAYDLVGKLLNLVPVHGKGPFKIAFDKINVAGHIKLRLKGLKYLELAEVKFLLSVGSMEFKIDGLMGKPDITELVNAVLNDMLPQLIVQEQMTISNFVQDLAKELLNPILSQLTLDDLLGMVNGGGGGGGLC